MGQITKSFTDLMNDGVSTANVALKRAVQNIDETLGAGYAKAHPELIIAFMRTATLDSGINILAKVIDESISSLANTIIDNR